MRIGILGTGDVGRALGDGFVARGHEVKLGARDESNEKAKAWADHHRERASMGTFAEAAAFAEMAVLATLWSGTANAIRLAGPHNLAGKVVIDATNPLVFRENGPPELALGFNDSGGEQIQRWLAGAHVVKAFNTVGHAHMVDPRFPGGPPDMFICGNDDQAKQTVADVCKSFGWPSIDVGGIECARLLEPMCILWVRHGIRTGSWNHAFKLLRR